MVELQFVSSHPFLILNLRQNFRVWCILARGLTLEVYILNLVGLANQIKGKKKKVM